jgi:hypothetical protein
MSGEEEPVVLERTPTETSIAPPTPPVVVDVDVDIAGDGPAPARAKTEKVVAMAPRVLVIDEDGMHYERITVREFFRPKYFEMTIIADPEDVDEQGIALYFHEDPPPGSYVYAASMALGEPFCNFRGPLVLEATDSEGDAVDISEAYALGRFSLLA